jgi:hypothetical protein
MHHLCAPTSHIKYQIPDYKNRKIYTYPMQHSFQSNSFKFFEVTLLNFKLKLLVKYHE